MKKFLLLLLTMSFILSLSGCFIPDHRESSCEGEWDEETETCTPYDDPKDNPNLNEDDDPEDITCDDCLEYDILSHINFSDWQITALTENNYKNLYYYDEDVMLFYNREFIEVTENDTTTGETTSSGEFLGYDKSTKTVHFESNGKWWEHVIGESGQNPSSLIIDYNFYSSYIGSEGFINEGRFFRRNMTELDITGFVTSYYPERTGKLFAIANENADYDFITSNSLLNPTEIVNIEITSLDIGKLDYKFFNTEVYQIIDINNHDAIEGFFSIDGESNDIIKAIYLDDFIPSGATNIERFENNLIGFRKDISYTYTLNSENYLITFNPDLTVSYTLLFSDFTDFVYLSNDYAIFYDDGVVDIYNPSTKTMIQSFDFSSYHQTHSARVQIVDHEMILNLDDKHVLFDTTDWSYVVNDGYAFYYKDYAILAPRSGDNDSYAIYTSNKEILTLPEFDEIILGEDYYYLVRSESLSLSHVDVYDYSGNKINTLNYVTRYSNHYLRQFIVELDGEYYLLGNTNNFITK